MNSTAVIEDIEGFRFEISQGIPNELPPIAEIDHAVSHAPKRKDILSTSEKKLALRNALRYFDKKHHAVLAPEFAEELRKYGRIYMHRFRPKSNMYAHPIEQYPAKSQQAAAIMLMIQNNLDPAVAQHPHELITYGGNGAVFQNWIQYRLTMKYLSEMSNEQTLVMYSGHPVGLFPSHLDAPRVVVTNGMMIPNYSKPDDWERFNALGVTQYGQMTAGSYMYIGPQGIVHGTTITVMNAARMCLRNRGNSSGNDDFKGMLFVTAGLGGMSGAQPKAAKVAGLVSITAEINPAASRKRHAQGWVDEVHTDLNTVIDRAQEARQLGQALSLAYEGNIIDLWEALVKRNIKVDIGSDQTSLHNPFAGGYYPTGFSLEESNRMMADEPQRFHDEVYKSLKRHTAAINTLAAQ
ncbi:MAG: urocanate hydratase, partial [Bacteroidia bacterium]